MWPANVLTSGHAVGPRRTMTMHHQHQQSGQQHEQMSQPSQGSQQPWTQQSMGQQPMGQDPMEQQPQSMGQQPQQSMGQQWGGQEAELALSDVESTTQQNIVHQISRAIQVCEWCADQCMHLGDPAMNDCIHLCEDVSDMGRTALALIPRHSYHTEEFLQLYAQVLEACAQECSQHHHAHCQECAQVLDGASSSLYDFIAESAQGGQMGSW